MADFMIGGKTVTWAVDETGKCHLLRSTYYKLETYCGAEFAKWWTEEKGEPKESSKCQECIAAKVIDNLTRPPRVKRKKRTKEEWMEVIAQAEARAKLNSSAQCSASPHQVSGGSLPNTPPDSEDE